MLLSGTFLAEKPFDGSGLVSCKKLGFSPFIIRQILYVLACKDIPGITGKNIPEGIRTVPIQW